jgi:RNA polymerase-binding transcription factor DksA
MSKEDILNFKSKLETELRNVEAELKTVGRVNPENPKDWQATPADMDIHRSESDEVADGIEAFEENTAILKQLETRFNEIKTALKKIGDGTYGICEVGGEPIPKDRLEANSAAATCLTHIKK